MIIKTNIWTLVVGCCLMAAGMFVDAWLNSGFIISESHAVLGRPATPASVAGVARRTTRRTIRRTTVYVATLPRGCTTVVIDSTTLHHCGSTYYQPYNNQYVIVNVD